MSYCPISTMMCNPDNCGLYSPDKDACKIKLALDKYLGFVPVEGEVESAPIADFAKTLPDASQVVWYVGKGQERYDARPEDKRAWAFVYKYDHDARVSTTEVRLECVELVKYIKDNGPLEMDGYKYTVSGKGGSFLGREKQT